MLLLKKSNKLKLYSKLGWVAASSSKSPTFEILKTKTKTQQDLGYLQFGTAGGRLATHIPLKTLGNDVPAAATV